jgi:AraC-like DNA-binding protein
MHREPAAHRPDLDPRAIADALHASVRTLHRAFATSEVSVMELVRQRRLERARADLLSTTCTVSEIAARWHFTDSSHFIRAYKKRYGETPTTLRRGVQPAAAHARSVCPGYARTKIFEN